VTAARGLLLVAAGLGALLLVERCATPPAPMPAAARDSAATALLAHFHAAHDRVAPETVRAERWRVRYDSIRRTDTLVVTRVDTLTRDTTRVVFVPAAPADSALGACTLARRTCATALATADTALTALAAARDAWRTEAQRRRWLSCGPGVALALDGQRVLVAPALSCHVPLVSR
jgi:hypothetical protein